MNTVNAGIYAMQVASKLTGMHPQTLRKYERAGFLTPSRHNMVRMYSDEDIARLRMIKYLGDELGLNLAGIELALNLRDKILEMKKDIVSSTVTTRLAKRLDELLDEMLEMLEVSSGRYCPGSKPVERHTSKSPYGARNSEAASYGGASAPACDWTG